MKQKVVIKVSRNGGKSRTKAKKIAIRTEAMKIAAGVSGCESVAICRQDVDQMEVTGEGIDPAALIKLLRRKLGFAELVSVAQLGEKKATTPSPSAASFQIIPMSEAMPWAFIPQRPTGENEELGKRKRQAEELKCKVIVLKRRIDFLGFILPYHVQSEEKESQYSLKSIFSIIHFRIRQFKGLTKKNKLATYTPEDIDRDIQRHFRTVREKLAKCLLHMGAYLPQYMLENMRDLWNSDDSEGRTEGVELMMPPSSNKSENAPRPYHEDDQWLCAPQEAQNLAINSAVHQIFDYFEGTRFGKIGISGSGWEEVAEALKDLPKIRYMFDVAHSVSLSQHQSIIELQRHIQEQVQQASDVSGSPPQPISLLLLVDRLDQQIELLDLEYADSICVVLKTQPQKADEIMELDLEIRMEDHLLLWDVFCKNVGWDLDHCPTLKQRAERLIEECHSNLIGIILLAGALKGVTVACVWELALQELLWQPSSQVQGINVVMINVLRFIWKRMDSTEKTFIKYFLLQNKGKEMQKAEMIFHGITNGWIETMDEGERILEGLTTSFLLENTGRGYFRMQEETKLVLLNVFIPGKDPAYLKQGDLGLTETPEDEEWVAKEINLMNNKLFELPESPYCPYLVKLFLQGNYFLMVIPPSFFECMPVLEVLDLSRTSIKCLPESISNLVALREFFLRDCGLLMELPPEIGALTNLEVFDLQGTKIMFLPKEIGEMVNLTSLKVYFNESAVLCKENKDAGNPIIPSSALSNLSQLNELSIDVHSDGNWWDVEVKAVINELCFLKQLGILKLYLPVVELLEELKWDSETLIYQALTHFRLIVGRQKQRFISRLPRKVEEEFNNLDKLQKGLKYINGEGIPIEITKALKYADAFFLECHWTIKYLSQFGLENMDKLKFCLVVECNELQAIIDAKQFYQGDREEDDHDESEPDLHSDEEIVLGSLQYLSIHYMKNMESICKRSVGKGSLSNMKYLGLHTCLSLTTIFTLDMLSNLINLEELRVEVCPKIKSIVSLKSSDLKSGHFLPSLKKISLIGLPELVSISSGLCIAPKLESMIIFYCPKLKMLSSIEVSSKDLKVIKGETEWWDELMWHDSDLSIEHQDYLANTFIPLRREEDLMAQLEKD